jgi:hypothetical protein
MMRALIKLPEKRGRNRNKEKNCRKSSIKKPRP